MIVYADLRWPDKTGIGVAKREVLRRAPPNFDIVDLETKGSIGSPASPFAIAMALQRHRPRKGVFWSPGFMPPFHCSIPTVVTVHDLTHLHFYSAFHVAYYNWILRRLYCKCTRVACDSEYTRQEFLDWSGFPAERASVIYLGVSEAFGGARSGQKLPFPYVFYAGNHRSYKNLDRLLEAYAKSGLPPKNVHLVFTGTAPERLLSLANRLSVSDLVHFVGHVSDAEMADFYKGALLVAFVSLYEGFGLPILEAMSAGVPVLTSDAASMPEIAGNAALIVDPYSVAAIAHGLESLAFDEDERRIRIQRGAERFRKFNWDTTAQKVWNLVELAARR